MRWQRWKKKNLKIDDFVSAAKAMEIDVVTVTKLIRKYEKLLPSMIQCVQNSFLNDELKTAYIELLNDRIGKIRNS